MEYDYYPEEYMANKKKKKSLVGRIFKWVFIALVLGVYLLIFFRIYIKSDTKTAKLFVWTPDTVAAYEQDSEHFDAYTQKNAYTYYDPDTTEAIRYSYDSFSGGNSKKRVHEAQFHTSEPIYVPASKEYTVTLRYNRDAVNELLTTYGLDKAPAGELFCFALTDGIHFYTDYTYLSDSRFTYQYRRLTFSGIDLDTVHELQLQIYYVGDTRKNSPYDTMTVYLSDIPLEAYSLKKALPAKVNDDLKTPPYVAYGE